jgi:Fe(3+) dicitrate transport protein
MLVRTLLAGVFLLSSVSSSWAQQTLSGIVRDGSGAPVPGVTVIVRDQAGTDLKTTVTGADGRFAVAQSAGQRVTVTAMLEGFAAASASVQLPQGDAVELTLQPSPISEAVTVLGAQLIGSEEMLRRTPGSYDALTRRDLESSRVFTTSEALRKVAGVTVRDEEGVGLRPNIGLRGLNPTRSTKVLLLEDGLPVTYAPYGDNASYYHPPVERFERVEVLKGSSQIAYGPVTLGGVINYITPPSPSRPSLSLDLTAGNRDYVNAGASTGGSAGALGYFGHVVRKQSDGSRDNIESQLTDVLGKATLAFGATQTLSVKGNYYGEDSQVTYSGLREAEYLANPRQNPFANDHFDGRRIGASVSYQTLVGSRIAATVQGYGSGFSRDWWRQSSNSAQRPNDAADPSCGGMANLNSTCGNEGRLRDYMHAGIEARGRMMFAGAVSQEVDFGARLHVEEQERQQQNGATPAARAGVLVENNHRTTDAVSAFVQHRVMSERWTLTPGVRIERIAYTRDNLLAGVSGQTTLTETVPGIGVSYGVADQVTLFSGVHKGFAPPRAEDIINNTTGGVVDLDPERSWNYEAGVRARAGAAGVSATAFHLDYSNQIVPASIAGGVGAALTNGGETLHQGIEAAANGEWPLRRDSRHGIYGSAAITWLPVARFEGVRTSSVAGFTSVSVSGNRLPYAPEWTHTLTLGYRHAAGFDLQFEAQHVGAQFGDDLNTVAASADGQRGLIDAHTYFNATASAPLWGSRGRVFIAAKNLADRTFIIDRVRGILPGHPRLLHVGTAWRF